MIHGVAGMAKKRMWETLADNRPGRYPSDCFRKALGLPLPQTVGCGHCHSHFIPLRCRKSITFTSTTLVCYHFGMNTDAQLVQYFASRSAAGPRNPRHPRQLLAP